MKKNVLITGSNGLLGQKLVGLLKTNYNVLATSKGENLINDKSEYLYQSLDITESDALDLVFNSFSPSIVINTAAMTNVDACEDQKEKCYAINVDAVQHLCDLCKDHDAYLIHISTDFIFDGENGPYHEKDVPNPLSYYGQSKFDSEKIVENSAIDWVIFRTIIIYGIADNLKRNNIVLWGRDALKKGTSINIIDDQFRAPTLAEDLAQACKLAIEKQVKGVYNISGKNIMSIFEMVERMADFYNCDKSNINRISSKTLNQKAVRPPKTGFILDKAIKELGYQPHSFEEGLQILEKQLTSK